MLRKTIFSISILVILGTFVCIKDVVYAESAAASYLCELGIAFYDKGRTDEALSEFNKVLMVDPQNMVAKDYVNRIMQRDIRPITLVENKSNVSEINRNASARSSAINNALDNVVSKRVVNNPPSEITKEEAINNTFNALDAKKKVPAQKPKVVNKPEERKLVALSGEVRLGLGITSADVIWKDANADKIGVPREKNYRYIWGDDRHNTYDPKIYDRLNLDMQTQFDSPLNAFMEITVDPWTFIGTNHVTTTSTAGGDIVDMDLKYWSNDSRTINEVYRSKKGNIINVKQVKVDDGETSVTTPTGLNDWYTYYNSVSPMEINRDYRPVRKLWFDYKNDDSSLKVFLISDQFEALTSDDPLRLSNNHVYWEESPWLDEYEPSNLFFPDSGLTPVKKGRWVHRLSFYAKDSSDDYPHRLTFLRGASFKSNNGSYSLEATAATPMSLWDEYESSNNVEGAARIKVPVGDSLELGITTSTKLGFNGGSSEALNQAVGFDFNSELSDSSYFYGEAAGSTTKIEEALGFNTTYHGLAGKIGLKYDDLKEKIGDGFYQNEIYIAHMDDDFYPGLSNYRYTRRDEPTLSRHIYFSELKDEDRALIWGDGIDRGRNVIGLNLKAKTLNEKIETDIKARRVQASNGKYIETVGRVESTYRVDAKLTSKVLSYYQHMPRTHANVDPVMYAKNMYSLTDYFSDDDSHPQNTAIIDDKDPSIGAFGLGSKYDFFKELSLEGAYERTNDPLEFPRGLLNDTYVLTEMKNDVLYDKVVPFLYDQKFFDLPPYHYYNIGKAKLIYNPFEQWQFILGHTFNENKHATGIDDNVNHTSLEADYMPNEKLTFWCKYIYSQLIDIYKQNKEQRTDIFEGHHNVFFGSQYRFNKDESFTFLFGEFVGYDDPYEQGNWTLSALDTQHIVRLFYRRKF